MTIEALLPGFVQLALVPLSLSLVLVLLVRRPLQKLAGPQVACYLWWLPPLVIVAALIPTFRPETLLLDIQLLNYASLAGTDAVNSADNLAPVPVPLVWLIGALATLTAQIVRELRFRHEVGGLTKVVAGRWQGSRSSVSPALVGVLHPKIVLPADFRRRYSRRQRVLIWCHERMHWKRRDHWANTLGLCLRSLFWFHPLVHLAWIYFRRDQELAVDAAVMARYPAWRRSYGEALTGLSTHQHQTSCRWQSNHLKERIDMLKQANATRFQSGLGRCIVLGALLLSCVAAWAGKVADSSHQLIYLTVDARIAWLEGVELTSREYQVVLGIEPGGTGTVSDDFGDGRDMEQRYTLNQLEDGNLDLQAEIVLDGERVASPRVVFPMGDEGATVSIHNDQTGSGISLAFAASMEKPEKR